MSKNFLAMILTLSALLLATSGGFAQNTFPAEDLADPDGQFIMVDDAQIYYIERGPADGPAVMLLHGFGGSTFTWRDNMDALSDAGYRVIAYDRPPFGLSDKSPHTTRTGSGQARQAVELMDALEIDSAVMVGHSAGGRVIAYIGTMFPERVDGLVFVAGAVGDDPRTPDADEQENGSALSGLFEFAGRLDPESPISRGLVRNFLSEEQFISLLADAYYDPVIVTDEVAAGYGRILRVEGWESAFLSLFSEQIEPEPLSIETLADLNIPILLIWGEEDTWVPVARGEALRERLPDAEWITYELTGHMPMEEEVERFNVDLLAFLTSTYNGQ